MSSQADFYDWFAAAYESQYKAIDAERTVQQWAALLQTVLPAEEPASRLRLLDVGCGPGWHLPHWHHRGFVVAGLDVSMAMLEFAKAEWSREVGGAVPPLYRADLLNLAGPILNAEPFDVLVLHSNILHLFPPKTLPSLFGALGHISAPGALLMADFTSAALLKESSAETIHIDGLPWDHVSHYDPAQGVLEQVWTNSAESMTELSWPIDLENLDRLFHESGWTIQTRVGWDPQDFEAPFREEWGDQARYVTIYGQANKRQVDH
jgi:SAM-dependent methyltransferase